MRSGRESRLEIPSEDCKVLVWFTRWVIWMQSRYFKLRCEGAAVINDV